MSNAPDYLGLAVDQMRRLFIAKFVAGTAPEIWHGYPADPERLAQDIPDENVLQRWMDGRMLPSQKVRKLMRGQRCKL